MALGQVYIVYCFIPWLLTTTKSTVTKPIPVSTAKFFLLPIKNSSQNLHQDISGYHHIQNGKCFNLQKAENFGVFLFVCYNIVKPREYHSKWGKAGT